MRSSGRSGRLYRALLRLLPRPFRDDWGADMEALFADRLAEVGDSRVGRARVWSGALVDLIVHGLRERLGSPAPEPARSSPAGPAGAPGHDRSPIPSPSPSGASLMDSLLQDLRHSLRTLVLSPGFGLAAVLTLALGVGAVTATFTVVDSVLLRPLPYHEPDRLVTVWPEKNFNVAMVDRFEDDVPAFERVSGYSLWQLTLTGDDDAIEVPGVRVSPDHFEVLGVRPLLGRVFRPEDGLPGGGDVAVLSHALWQARFGADPDIVGRRIQLGGADHEARTVIGVLPPGHRPLSGNPVVWTTLEVEPGTAVGQDGSWFVNVRVARLAEGATRAQAAEQARAVALRIREEIPSLVDEESIRTVSVDPIQSHETRNVRGGLWVSLAAGVLVLLIACTNVANLMLARGERRLDELALRIALGARGGRLVRQLLTESLVLGLVGGALGAGLAYALVRLVSGWAPADFPGLAGLAVDPRALGFALVASLSAAVLFGVLPAVRAAHVDGSGAFRGGGARSGRLIGGGRGLSRWLMTGEIALAALLVVGAGLMVRTLAEMADVDPGFRPEGLIAFRMAPTETRYPDTPAVRGYYDRVLERLRATPGVASAGLIQLLPMQASNWSFPTYPEDRVAPEGTPAPSVNFRVVSPGYFETMGVPIRRGRTITPEDRAEGPRVVLVNQAFVDRFYPDADPLGREVRVLSRSADPYRIVGVVGDVRQFRITRDPDPEVYVPHHQWGWHVSMWSVVRLGGPAERASAGGAATAAGAGTASGGAGASMAASALERAAREVDAQVPVSDFAPMTAVMGDSESTVRFFAMLLIAFAGLALSLAALGVYAVTAYVVSQRVPEFGLRIALGSSRAAVIGSALARALPPVVIGTASGVLAALMGSRVLATYLFGVEPTDPLTYLTVIGVLGSVALAGVLVPAWRGASADPMSVLRSE